MRKKDIDTLSLQETKSRQTNYYMVVSHCFHTFSNVLSNQKEYVRTGFVLSPRARAPGPREWVLTEGGGVSILTAHVPHNQHEKGHETRIL